jgi:hypothetical protein
MATVNLGSIKFKWKGTYSGATAYTVDDVVEYNGSSYICILASTGNLPTNATYFEQMSSAGTNGTDLTTTLTTQGDIVYRDGSGLVRLGAGTSGQYLKTNGAGANPAWSTVTSKVGAIAHFLYKDAFASAVSQTWTEVSNYNCTITPTAAGSTILAMGHISSGCTSGGPAGHGFTLYRSVAGASNSQIDDFTGNASASVRRAMVAGASESGSDWTQENGSFNVVDSSSTGLSYTLGQSIKYSMYQWNASTTGNVVVNRSKRDENGNDDIRSTSSITLIEILA